MTIRETALRRIAIRHTGEITVGARGNPAHRVENGPANGEGQDGRRSPGRSYRTLVSGPRRRDLMPPCGSPLMRTTNSVSLPVSELNASSELIRDDPDDAIPANRSHWSRGKVIRTRVA